MAYKGHSAAVLAFFEKNPDRTIHLDELSSGTALTKNEARRAVHSLRGKSSLAPHIEIVLAGQAYRWRTEGGAQVPIPRTEAGTTRTVSVVRSKTTPEPVPKIYTQVGMTQAGMIIARDDQHNLYEVKPL